MKIVTCVEGFYASVVVKVLTEEAFSDQATALVAAEDQRIAPDILTLEIASALSRKGDMPVYRTFLSIARCAVCLIYLSSRGRRDFLSMPR